MQISLPIFALFSVKSCSITQWLVSRENTCKKSKNPSTFFRKTMGSNISFILIEKIQVFKTAKVKFSVTVHFVIWEISTQLWPVEGLDRSFGLFPNLRMTDFVNILQRFIFVSFRLFYLYSGKNSFNTKQNWSPKRSRFSNDYKNFYII